MINDKLDRSKKKCIFLTLGIDRFIFTEFALSEILFVIIKLGEVKESVNNKKVQTYVSKMR